VITYGGRRTFAGVVGRFPVAVSGYDVGVVVEMTRRWQRPALTICPATAVTVGAACHSDDKPSLGRGSVSGSARRHCAQEQYCTATTADVGRTRHVYLAFGFRQMCQRSKIAAYFDKKRIFRWQQVKNTTEDRETERTVALSATRRAS